MVGRRHGRGWDAPRMFRAFTLGGSKPRMLACIAISKLLDM